MIKDSIAQYITQWCHLKTWPPPIIMSRTGPIITMRRVHENKAVHIHSLENLSCACNHELTFSQKCPRFNEVIWKCELPLFPRAEIFTKIRQFWWSHLKIRTAPIIARKNFPKNKAASLMQFQNLACPNYRLVETWNLDPLLVLMKSFGNFNCSSN